MQRTASVQKHEEKKLWQKNVSLASWLDIAAKIGLAKLFTHNYLYF